MTIGLSSSDTTQGTVNKSSLTFTSANWDIPQTVTVTGVDDAVDDGDIAYSIVTAPATSAGGYNGQDASDVSVTNTDNDTAGITVNPTAGLFDDRRRRHSDVHGGPEFAADRERDDWPELEQHDRRHRQPGQPDLHQPRTGTRRRPSPSPASTMPWPTATSSTPS